MADTQRIIRIVIDATKARDGGKQAESALAGISTAATRLAGVLGGLFAVDRLKTWADAYKTAGNQLLVATGGLQAAAKAQAELFNISQRSRTSFEANVELYSRLNIAAKELGKSQSEMLKFTDVVAKSISIQGKSGAAAAGALLQLSQAMGGAKIQAQEFNSLVDGAPRLLQAAAQGMDRAGGSVSKLTQLVKSGQVTNREFFEAIMKGAEGVDRDFAKTGATIGQALTVANNALIKYIGEVDKAYGISAAIAGTIILVADNLDVLGQALTIAAGALAGFGIAYLLAQLSAMPAALAAVAVGFRAVTVAIISNPIGAVAAAIGAVIGAVYAFRNETVKVGDTSIHVGAVVKTVWDVAYGAISNALAQLRDFYLTVYNLTTLNWSGVKESFASMMKNGGESVDAVTGALETYRKNVEALTKAQEENADVAKTTTAPAIEEQYKWTKESTSALDEYLESLNEELYIMGFAKDLREQETAVLRAQNLAMKEGNLLTLEQADAIRAVVAETNRLEQADRDAADAAAELKSKAKEATDEIKRIAERTTDRIVDGFADMLKGGKDAFRSLKDFALSTFREIAANALIRPIIQPIVNAVTGNAAGGAGGIPGGLNALSTSPSYTLSGLSSGAAAGFAGYSLSGALVRPRQGPGNEIGSTIGGTAGFMLGGPVGAFVGSFLGGVLGGLFGSKPSDKLQFSNLALDTGNITTGGFTGKKFSQENLDAATRLGTVVRDLSSALQSASGGKSLNGKLSFEVGSRDGISAIFNDTERQNFTNSAAGAGQAIKFAVDKIAAQLGDSLPQKIRDAIGRADFSNVDQAVQDIVDAVARAQYGTDLRENLTRQIQELENPFTSAINRILDGYNSLSADATEFGLMTQLNQLRDLNLAEAFKGMDRDALQRVITYYSTVQNNAAVVAAATRAMTDLNTVTAAAVEYFTGMTDAESAIVDSGLSAIDVFISSLEDGLSDATAQAEKWRSLINSVGAARSSLLLDSALSPLSPGGRLNEAQSQFNALKNRAQLGDVSAIEQLPEASRTYLTAAREYYAGGQEYYARFAEVQNVLSNTESVAQRQLDIAEAQATTLQSQLDQARATRTQLDDLINGQRTMANSLADLNAIAAQIAAIIAAASVARPVTPPTTTDASTASAATASASSGDTSTMSSQLSEIRDILARNADITAQSAADLRRVLSS